MESVGRRKGRKAEGNFGKGGSGNVRHGGSQQRGREGRNEDAADETADLRQPEGGHAANASRAQRGDRSAAQDSGLGGRAGKSLGFLQYPGLSAGTARHPPGVNSKHTS